MANTDIWNYYVDASIGGTSGDGSVGDPWSSLQYAATQWDAVLQLGTNIVNTKAGVTEDLTGPLQVTSSMTTSRRLFIRGYGTTPGDGVRAHVRSPGNLIDWANPDGLTLKDMIFESWYGNTPVTSSDVAIKVDRSVIVENCEISGGFDCLSVDGLSGGYIKNCHIHSFLRYGIVFSGLQCQNFIDMRGATNSATRGSTGSVQLFQNIVVADDTTHDDAKAFVLGTGAYAKNNTAVSFQTTPSATNYGFYTGTGHTAQDNVIIGWGSGLHGYQNTYALNNILYNNVEEVTQDAISSMVPALDWSNISAVSNPIEAVGLPTYENRFDYFRTKSEYASSDDYGPTTPGAVMPAATGGITGTFGMGGLS